MRPPNVRLGLLLGILGLLASFAFASSAGAVTVTGVTANLVGGAKGSIAFNTGSGVRACEVSARGGAGRLGPLRFRVHQPLVVITGKVPHSARTLAWSVSIKCRSSSARIARTHTASVRVHVRGNRKGASVLFSPDSVHIHSYPADASVAPEPEQPRGGKGGYVCASAWDDYRSVLDASSYCTGYCTWFVWQKRPEQQLENLGNAWEWYGAAKARGIPVGSTPVVGAIAWWGISAHAPEGHVAYVIGVSGSSVTIIEMNRIAWDAQDTRTLTGAELPGGYIYGGPAGSGQAGNGATGGATQVGGSATGSPGANGYQLAFQANTNELIAFGADATSNTSQGMMPGTSPSVTALAGGGYETAFQANTGNLIVYGTGGDINTGQGMKPGTSPSIAASPQGGFEVAFQANTGNLYIYNSAAGPANLQQGMDNNTSPAIAALAGGGYETAFQANTGNLIVYGAGGNVNTGQGMKPETSPAIAAAPGGGFEAAFQANTGNLYIYNSAAGPANLQQGMDNNTSPAIAP
jgi:surface antigen